MPDAACAPRSILAIIAAMGNDFIETIDAAQLEPGKMTCVEAGGQRILIANVDGILYAVDDTCTHEDASLSSGSLTGDLVKCPLHGSRFSVRTGAPLEDPAEEPLRCYAVKINEGRVLIGLNSRTHR